MATFQTQSVIPRLRKLDAVLVVSVTSLSTAAPLVPPTAAIAAASRNCRLGCAGLVQAVSGSHTAFDLLRDLLRSRSGRRAVFLACLSPWSALLRRGRAQHLAAGTVTWAQWGSFDATVRFLSVAAWLLAAAALLSWYFLLRPNITDIVKRFVQALPLALLIAGGLIFSMVNAAVEEGAYHGVILHALDRSLGPDSRLFCCKPLPLGRFIFRGSRAAGSALVSLVSTGCSWGSFGDALAACSLPG